MQLIFCLGVICLLGFRAIAQPIDFCDAHPESHVGRELTVRARIAFTMHGAALLSNHCRHKAQPAALLNPHDPGAPDVAFELDRASVDLLKPFLRISGGGAEACGTISGQFASKPGFKAFRRDGELMGNGFGARGALRFAFVLHKVVEIGPCP